MALRVFLLLGAAWPCTAFAEAQVTAPLPSPAARPAIATDAWYRTWVRVDDSFFTKHERNLFEESVGLHFRDLVGTHEAFVNGVKVGAGSGREADPPAAPGSSSGASGSPASGGAYVPRSLGSRFA